MSVGAYPDLDGYYVEDLTVGMQCLVKQTMVSDGEATIKVHTRNG